MQIDAKRWKADLEQALHHMRVDDDFGEGEAILLRLLAELDAPPNKLASHEANENGKVNT